MYVSPILQLNRNIYVARFAGYLLYYALSFCGVTFSYFSSSYQRMAAILNFHNFFTSQRLHMRNSSTVLTTYAGLVSFKLPYCECKFLFPDSDCSVSGCNREYCSGQTCIKRLDGYYLYEYYADSRTYCTKYTSSTKCTECVMGRWATCAVDV